MQNHSCPFAKYCSNYRKNTCQGCNKATDKYYECEKKVSSAVYQAILDSYKSPAPVEEVKVTVYDAMDIRNVYFNKPMTIVIWKDGTKTMVKCQDGDLYSKETGLAIAIAKKALGNKGNFNEVFKKWIPDYAKEDVKEVCDAKEDVKEVCDTKEDVKEICDTKEDVKEVCGTKEDVKEESSGKDNET